MNPLRAIEILQQSVGTDTPAPLLVAAVTVSAIVLLSILRRQFTKQSPPPLTTTTDGVAVKHPVVLPGTLPVFGNTFQVLQNAHRMYEWLTEQCAIANGEPFEMRILGRYTSIFVVKPELLEDVQKLQFDTFEKGPRLRGIFFDLLGNGIFAADSAIWVHQRKTGSNLFTTRSLRDAMTHTVHDLLPVMHRHLQHSVDTQTPIDLVNFFSRFTLEAFADIGFGVRLGCLYDLAAHRPFQAAFDGAQRLIANRVLTPPPIWKLKRWLGVGSERQLKEHIQVIDDTVLSIISSSLEQRRSGKHSNHKSVDLVTLFLNQVENESNDDSGFDRFDPVYLRDVVVNFLMAGRDTTSSLLSWFFYRMSLHPDIAQKIVDEIRSVLPPVASGQILTPTMDDVSSLVYLEAAVRETLRIHPPVPGNARLANKDTVLRDGTFIPKGSSVSFSNYMMGRQTKLWGADALEFKPERWLDPTDPTKIRTVSAYQFNAFLAGPRICLGMNLAMVEAKIVIASLLHAFHAHVLQPEGVTYDFSITLSMKGSLDAIPVRRATPSC